MSGNFLSMIDIYSYFSPESQSLKLIETNKAVFVLERIVLWTSMTMNTFDMQIAE
jgi:hypothetical protein